MKIPETVKINGSVYSVTIEPKSLLEHKLCGVIDYMNGAISIEECGSKDYMQKIMLHECIHGMMEALGINEQDEKLTDGLAHQLFMLIKDNPEMFKE